MEENYWRFDIVGLSNISSKYRKSVIVYFSNVTVLLDICESCIPDGRNGKWLVAQIPPIPSCSSLATILFIYTCMTRTHRNGSEYFHPGRMEESRRSIDPTTKDEGIKNGFRSVKLTCVYSYRGRERERERNEEKSIPEHPSSCRSDGWAYRTEALEYLGQWERKDKTTQSQLRLRCDTHHWRCHSISYSATTPMEAAANRNIKKRVTIRWTEKEKRKRSCQPQSVYG